jgi:hypothetical protein
MPLRVGGPGRRARAALLCLAGLWASDCEDGCGARRASNEVPSPGSLAPYDFAGHTALKLRRLCRAADRSGGAAGARRQLHCAETLLDWYLVASLREDTALTAALARFAGRSPEAASAAPAPGVAILQRIEARFADAAARGAGPSLRRRAHAGARLARLQWRASRRWGYRYLHGIARAARATSPYEIQARVIVAGAALDALRTLRKAKAPQRRELLVQGLGFACPAEAEAARAPGPPTHPPSCPLACPGLRSAIYRLSPIRRKALVAAQCPLSYLGISQRAHGIYLSPENLLVTRSVAYQLENLARLRTRRDHPLVDALWGALGSLEKRLAALRVPLGLPELSPGEPVHFQLPLCASADERVTAPLYLAVDETRLFAGPVPVLGIRGGQVTFLDWREGYPFPGRKLHVADRAALRTQLARLRRTYRRITGGQLPVPTDRVAIYADTHLSAGRLKDLLDLLVQVEVTRAELVFRNSQHEIRTVAVALAPQRRSEGPPLEAPDPEPIPAKKAPLRMHLGARQLRLEAAAGPLKKAPLQIPAGDLAGLRQTLEKTRRDYRAARGVRVRLGAEVTYRELARLLHHLRRNSSGRVLYSTLIL